MPNPTTPSAPQAAPPLRDIIVRYQDRLYRLALLITGSPSAAAERLVAAFTSPAAQAADPELALALALLPASNTRLPRWSWWPDADLVARSELTSAQATALLNALAQATPLARLQLGLVLVLGLPATAVAQTSESSDEVVAPWQALRCTLAQVLGFVPQQADQAQLLSIARFLSSDLDGAAVVQVRSLLLTDATARSLRDGLMRSDNLLQRALPALFATTLPLSLSERLIRLTEAPRPLSFHILRRPQLILAGVVALVVALILVLPELLHTQTTTPAATAPAGRDPAELVAAAIRRFDQAPLHLGVLNEVYTAELQGQRWTIERWYDYATPHRLKVVVAPEGDTRPFYALATEGRSQVQYRWRYGTWSNDIVGLDIQSTAEEIAAAMPILRQQPDSMFFSREWVEHFDLSQFYLLQAYRSNPTSLGTTTVAGREAWLLTYRSEQPFPRLPPTFQGGQSAPALAPARVILALDQQTYALLEVSVLVESAVESVAQKPWRVSRIGVAPVADNDSFTLTPVRGQQQRRGLASARLPELPVETLLSPSEALRRAQAPIYVPTYLPDQHMRGLMLLNGDDSIALLYEGPFSLLFIIHGNGPALDAYMLGEEQRAGEFRYRVLRPPEGTNDDQADTLVVGVVPPGSTEPSLFIISQDMSVPVADQEERVAAIVDSLQLLTEENLHLLGNNFYRADEQGSALMQHVALTARNDTVLP